jgi:hypothetical protein
MLFGGFAESKANSKTGEWVVRLPDDDVDALAIILNIIHGRPQEVPRKMPFKPPSLDDSRLLGRIAMAADKYGVTPILQPWAGRWIAELKIQNGWLQKHWFGDVLWAAWLLGDEDLLLDQLDQVVQRTFPPPKPGTFKYNKGEVFQTVSVVDVDLVRIYPSDIATGEASMGSQILEILDVWGMYCIHYYVNSLSTNDRAGRPDYRCATQSIRGNY